MDSLIRTVLRSSSESAGTFSSLAHIVFRLNEISREFDVRALIDVSRGAAEPARGKGERGREPIVVREKLSLLAEDINNR